MITMIEWNFFSFFLTSEEPFLELNTNFLETNVANILILLGILFYANKVSFSVGLKNRQDLIIQTIENAQTDVLNAYNYYAIVEKGYSQTILWLQSWKSLCDNEKIEIVNNKYKVVKNGLLETFSTSENLIENFENKTFLALQRYLILTAASKMLRKFLALSDAEKSDLIGTSISKLGGGIRK